MNAARGAPTARELATATVVAALLAIVFTWPLAARLGTAARVDTGDGRYSIWNVAWVAHALTSDDSVWNANIFYPQRHALAFSEANLVAGVIGVPIWVLTKNPIATSNFTILVSFVLAGVCMFALVRYLTGSRWGAALAGTVYAFCSYTFAHLAHIQLLMTFGPPLALLAMHQLIERPSTVRALWLGVVLAVQGLACGYYGLFGGLAVALGILWFGLWSGQIRSLRFWARVLLAAVVAFALVLPFLQPYLDIQRAGFGRTLDDARIYDAGWRSYFASALVAYRWMLPYLGHWREVLFPGFMSLGLAALAITRSLKSEGMLSGITARRLIGFYVVLAVMAAWGSLGPDAGLYRLLFETVPFMSMLRAPARLGLLVTLASAVLAGIGVASLEMNWRGSRRVVWLTVLMVATLARSTVGPLDWADAPAPTPAVRWLSKLPRGPVAAFPFYAHEDMSHETHYMLQSTWHWQPLLNGYSDFIPDAISRDLPRLRSFPSADALRALRERQARYILVNWHLYGAQEREHVRSTLAALPSTYRLMLNGPETSLYELSADVVDADIH